MGNYSQNNRNLAIQVDGFGDNDLLLEEFTGTEGLSELFNYELTLLSTKAVSNANILGASATITLKKEDGSNRIFNGIITEFICLGKYKDNDELNNYQAILSPKLALLKQNHKCRILKKKTALQIIEKILNEWKIEFSDKKLNAKNYVSLEHSFQYHETDFNYISRLMEKNGIFYYFDHGDNDGKKYHKLILLDQNPKLPGTNESSSSNAPELKYSPSAESDNIYFWQMHEKLGLQNVNINDYNFEQTKADYTQSLDTKQASKLTNDLKNVMTHYDDLGNFRNVENRSSNMSTYGKRVAEVLSQANRCKHINWQGKTKNRSIHAGLLFSLANFPGQNTLQVLVKQSVISAKTTPYRPGRLTLEHDEEFEYNCSIICHDNTVAFRAPFLHQTPTISSVERAKITTTQKSDSAQKKYNPQIQTDKDGRVLILFNWNEKDEDQKTCWARLANPSGGKNFGQINLPTFGQEVMVSFINGSPDDPIVIGAVYNDENPPPVNLLDNRMAYSSIMRGRTVNSTGVQAGSITDGNVKNLPQKMTIKDLAQEKERKNYNEISMYNMQGSYEAEGWPVASGAEKAADFFKSFFAFSSPVELVEDIDNIVKLWKNSEKEEFEGISLYSNNQIMSQSSQDHTIQSGRNVVIEAANSITLKVGRASICLTDSGITMREACQLMPSSIYQEEERMDFPSWDSILSLKPGQAQLYGCNSYVNAFLQNAMSTVWGAGFKNVMCDSKISATTINATAGSGVFKRIGDMASLVSAISGCIPSVGGPYDGGQSKADKVFGTIDNVHNFIGDAASTVYNGAVLVDLIIDMAKCMIKDMKYLLTLSTSSTKMTPKDIKMDSSKIELEGNPINLQGSPVAGYDTAIFHAAGDPSLAGLTELALDNIASMAFAEISINDLKVSEHGDELEQTFFASLNQKAGNYSKEYLVKEENGGEEEENVMQRETNVIDVDENLLQFFQDVGDQQVNVGNSDENVGVRDQNAGVQQQGIVVNSSEEGVDIEIPL